MELFISAVFRNLMKDITCVKLTMELVLDCLLLSTLGSKVGPYNLGTVVCEFVILFV